MENDTIKILIADDHAVVRRGVKEILAEEFPNTVLGEAGNAQEVIQQVGERKWDLVILDISLPGRSGLDALREMKQIRPALAVLVFSTYSEDQFAVRTLRAGAAGYVTKTSLPKELVQAVRRILGGGKHITRALAETLADCLEDSSAKPFHDTLSDREYQIMCLVASGKTLREIAEDLRLGESTVSTYRQRVFRKLRVKKKSELVQYVLQHRLIH